MVKKLLHTRYRVTDLEKTVAFYRDVLGLESGSVIAFVDAPEGYEIELIQRPK
jgi:lactoylglutathione lyase